MRSILRSCESRLPLFNPAMAAYLKLPTADEAIGKSDFDIFGEERAPDSPLKTNKALSVPASQLSVKSKRKPGRMGVSVGR